jgi:hypothetical protein
MLAAIAPLGAQAAFRQTAGRPAPQTSTPRHRTARTHLRGFAASQGLLATAFSMAHEIAKLLLEHAETFLERTEAIRAALSLGMPLEEIEEYLDWLDAVRGQPRDDAADRAFQADQNLSASQPTKPPGLAADLPPVPEAQATLPEQKADREQDPGAPHAATPPPPPSSEAQSAGKFPQPSGSRQPPAPPDAPSST